MRYHQKFANTIFKCLCLSAISFQFLFEISCINRNNPFDPLNFHPDIIVLNPDSIKHIRDSTNKFISEKIALYSYSATFDSISENLKNDSTANGIIVKDNNNTHKRNDSLKINNNKIEVFNDTVSSQAMLIEKDFLDTLKWMKLSDTMQQTTLRQIKNTLLTQKNYIRMYIDSINAAYFIVSKSKLDSIYSNEDKDSILQIFDSTTAICESFIEDIIIINQMVNDTNNISISPYNSDIRTTNLALRAYNDMIKFKRENFKYTIISTVDSLKNKLLYATAGDTFVLAKGVFTRPSIRFLYSGTLQNPIVIRGQPDMSSVLSIPDILLSGNGYIQFYNIVFTGAGISGVKAENISGPISFMNCNFEKNARDGIEIIDSEVHLKNCRILNNGSCGLTISSSGNGSSEVDIENSLIAHNQFHGIQVTSTPIYLHNVTISDNGQNGIHLNNPERNLRITNSLITYNAYGIYYESGFNGNMIFSINNSDLYGNTDDEIHGTFSWSLDYWTMQVAYVDRASDDYSIVIGSLIDQMEKQSLPIKVGYREN